MIQASELRIGNLLKDDKGSFVKVDIDVMKIVSYSFFDGSLKPIEITNEILEAAGFRHFTLGWYEKRFGDNLVSINLRHDKMCIDDEFNVDKDPATLPLPAKYLHQLQNLYHALTGKELLIIIPIPA